MKVRKSLRSARSRLPYRTGRLGRRRYKCPSCKRYAAHRTNRWGKLRLHCGRCGADSQFLGRRTMRGGFLNLRVRGYRFRFEIEKAGRPGRRNPFWPHIRRQVLARDGHTCQRCGRRDHLHVHHVLPVSQGGGDELDNLLTLCKYCHARQHRQARGLILSAGPRRRRIHWGTYRRIAIAACILLAIFLVSLLILVNRPAWF